MLVFSPSGKKRSMIPEVINDILDYSVDIVECVSGDLPLGSH